VTPQIRDPEKLCPCIRAKYKQFVEQCRDAFIVPALIETLRAADRQQYYMDIGVSWTMASKHLPQPPNGLSLAFDVCPSSYLKEPKWFPFGPLWDEMGAIGQSIGLKWGVWRDGKNIDKPHYYLDACECPPVEEEE